MVSPKERSTSPVPTSESSSWTDVVDSRTAFARKVAHITPIKEAEGFGERLPGVQPRRSPLAHFSQSHVMDSALSAHLAAGWTVEQFLELKEVTEGSLDMPNVALGLRLRGYKRYVYETFDAKVRLFLGYSTDDNGVLRASSTHVHAQGHF